MPNDIEALKSRLRDRAKRMNGALVGASDGGTYALGYYDQFAAADDKEAATALDQQSARIQELGGALGTAENRIVALYDGIAPQAHYEDLGIEGNRSGNRHADNDEVVLRIRSALGRNADG